MKNKYYIVSDIKTGEILITKSYDEIYTFICVNKNAKIRLIDINIKPKIIDRRTFLTEYLKSTKNQNGFFELVKIMIKYDYDISKYLKSLNIYNEYKYYINNKTNILFNNSVIIKTKLNENNLGLSIKEIRKNRGYKQKEFAEKIGLTSAYYNTIESGIIPSIKILTKIATELKTDISIVIKKDNE